MDRHFNRSNFSSMDFYSEGFEGEVEKLSKRKFFFHPRYLCLKDDVLSYFKSKPPDTGLFPAKAEVLISDCQAGKAPPELCRKKKRPYMLRISFTVNNKNKPKIVDWYFAVPNETALNSWLEAIEYAKEPFEEFNYEIEPSSPLPRPRVLESDIKKEDALESLKHSEEIEKRKARERERELEEKNKKKAYEEEIKRLQEIAEKKKQEEIEANRLEKYRKLLSFSWDYKFQKLWTQILSTSNDFEQNLSYGIQLYKLLGIFKVQATEASRKIIDELYLPIEKRKFRPLTDSVLPMYIYNNMILRLTWDSENETTHKLFGHEFRAADMIVDALFLLGRKDPNFTIRVPLYTLVDYKGFRVHIMALCPLDGDRTLIHGPKQNGVFLVCLPIYEELSYISQIINLKEHKFEWNEKIAPAFVHLSAFTEFHKSLGYSDLEEYVRSTVGDEAPGEHGGEDHIYILKLSDLLPIDIDIHEKEPDFSMRIRPEYLCELDFPLSADAFINISRESTNDDIEVADASRVLRYKKLEIMVDLLDRLAIIPIDSKSMTQALHSQGINMRYLGYIAENTSLPHIKDIATVEILARTAKHILNQQLSEIIMENNKQAFLEYEASQEPDSPDSREKESRNSSVEKIQGIEKEAIASYSDSLPFRKRAFTKKITESLEMPLQETIENTNVNENIAGLSHIKMDHEISEAVIDFINLLFGSNAETSDFWREILTERASQAFKVRKELLEHSEINLHAMLHAICYHCGLELQFDTDTPIGIVEFPFNPNQLLKISEKCKIYSMKNIEYRMLADKYAEYKKVNNHALTLQASHLKLKLFSALNPQKDYYGDPSLLADIGEIFLEMKDVDSALKKAKEALIQIHPLHAESVKSWCVLLRGLVMKSLQDEALQCFENALTALEYHWGPYHPLHSTIYSILAYHYMEQENYEDALVLYNNSLMCCLRVLGPNHPHIAEVYLELGKFYLKAKSSSEALAAIEKGHAIYVASFGEDELITISAAVQLAHTLVVQGFFHRAEPIIEKSCSVHYSLIEELKSSEECDKGVKLAHHYDKLCEILALGLTVGISTYNSTLVIEYANNLWAILAIRNDSSDRQTVERILRLAFESKITQMQPERRNSLLSVFLNPPDKREFVEIGNTEWVYYVQTLGGISLYLDQLLGEVIEYTRSFERSEEEIRRANEVLNTFLSILEFIGTDVMEGDF